MHPNRPNPQSHEPYTGAVTVAAVRWRGLGMAWMGQGRESRMVELITVIREDPEAGGDGTEEGKVVTQSMMAG